MFSVEILDLLLSFEVCNFVLLCPEIRDSLFSRCMIFFQNVFSHKSFAKGQASDISLRQKYYLHNFTN